LGVRPYGERRMRHHLRMVAVLAVATVVYGVLIFALRMMSQPSDRAWYGGIALIFGLLLFVPLVVREIWRRL
jgi:heme/copper-type cytochrome/quinol oxidase subunit 4